jgi:hypothetical protein
VGEYPAVLIARVATRNLFGHEAFEMIVKPRMGAEQFNRLGACGIVQMLVGDQCDNLVAGRIPSHRL